MNKPTLWELGIHEIRPEEEFVTISRITPDGIGQTLDYRECAAAAVAMNFCCSINPSNPLAVAEALPELVSSLKAFLQPYGCRNIYENLTKARAAIAKLETK